MNRELIDDDTLDALPDDPGAAFVLFERTCRTTLMDAIAQEDNSNVIQNLQLDYMHDVTAAAQFFDIPDLKDISLPTNSNYQWEVFEAFNRKVRFFTTHYRLSARAQKNRHSVELQQSHKDRIRTLLSYLREAVEKADMPDWRRDRLRKRIAEFEKALDARRLNFAEAMVFIGLLGAGLHGLGDGAEGAAKLVHEIAVAIGQSKEVEDETRPALPAPQTKPPVYLIEDKAALRGAELDDEIPF